MAFSEEIKVKLGADITGLKRGLAIAKRDIGEIGEETNRVLKRKLGGGDAFKGGLVALGISVEGIAEKIVEPFKRAAEEATRIADASARGLDFVKKMIALRNTPEQNLKNDEKELARMRAEAASLSGGTVVERGRGHRKERVEATEEAKKQAQELTDQANALELSIAERKKKTAEDVKKSESKLDEDLARQERNDLEQQILEGNKLYLESIEKKKKADKDRADAERKLDEDLAKARRDDLQKQIEDGNKLYMQQQKTLADAKAAVREMSGATFSQDLNGTRGNSTTRAQARNVQSLRRRAERIRDGGNGTFLDSNGKPISREAAADELETRANKIQNGISNLKESEKNPLGKEFQAALDASKVLQKISNNLEPTDAEDS